MRPILKSEQVSALWTILRPVALLFVLFWLASGVAYHAPSNVQLSQNADAYVSTASPGYAHPAIWTSTSSDTFRIVPVMNNTKPGRVNMNALSKLAGRNPLYRSGINPNRIVSRSVLGFNPQQLMIYPGETTLVEVRVSNPASVSLRGYLSVQSPPGWLALVAGDPRIAIQPGQYRMIPLQIGAPVWAQAQRVEIPVYLSGAGRAYGGSIIVTVPYLEPTGLATFGITGGNYLRFTTRGGIYLSDSVYVLPGAAYTISMDTIGAPIQATIVETDGYGNVVGESQPVFLSQPSDGWYPMSGIYVVGPNTAQLQLRVIALGQAMVGNVVLFPVLQAPGNTETPPEVGLPEEAPAVEPGIGMGSEAY